MLGKKKKAAKTKSLITQVTSAFQPVTITAHLSHTMYHRPASSWVGSLNEKIQITLGKGYC